MLLVLLLLGYASRLMAQGLKFIGMGEPIIDKRTSIKVFGGRERKFSDSLEISFDLCSYHSPDFGFIFRLKNLDGNGRTWNLSYYREGGQVEIRLNEEAHYTIVKEVFDESDFTLCQWAAFSLKIDMVNHLARLTVSGKSVSAKIDLPREIAPVIEFGCSDHYIDVADIALRFLKIRDRENFFVFPFAEWDGNYAYDAYGNARCTIRNPDWLLKESMVWNKVFKLSSPDIAGASFDRNSNTVYFFNKEEITAFNVASGISTTRVYPSECPTTLFCGRSWISSDGRFLTAYEPFTYSREEGSPTISRLDLETLNWTALGYQQLEQHMHHHSGLLNPESGRYFIFGGFGKQMYNGNFYEMSDDGKWNRLDNFVTGPDRIQPRFFQGMGLDKEGKYLYIFGGMGNECGEQVVGREYFRDLYRINIRTGVCRRLWESRWESENMVPVGRLIVDGDYFYTLCYPEYKSEAQLHLYKVSIKDGSFEEYAKPFSIKSDHIKTNIVFDYEPKMQKFIVASVEYQDQQNCDMSVYTLSYPPVAASHIDFIENRRIRRIILMIATVLVAIGVIVAVIALVSVQRRRKFSRQYSDAKDNLQKRIFNQKTRPGGIYLFGEFTVTDAQGRDISGLFTTQLREILYLIIKYNGDGGVSAGKLGKIMWPDKDEMKVKNSRGVSIQKLRKLLQMMNGPEIVYEEGRYRLDLSGGGYCDYFDYIRLLNAQTLDTRSILDILSRGRFLRETGEATFDSFKAETEQSSMDFLQKEVQEAYNGGRYNETIEICDMIYSIDENDETALSFTVRTLRKMGRTDDARIHYAEFSSRWRKGSGEEYPIGIEKL